MISAIECACMHSRLPEEEIKSKYGWVLSAMNEFASRTVLDETESAPAPALPVQPREIASKAWDAGNSYGKSVGFLYPDKETYINSLPTTPAPVQQDSDAWISVEDDLPKPFVRVLCFVDFRGNLGGTFVCLNVDEKKIWVDYNSLITHWQPLPQPPSGK